MKWAELLHDATQNNGYKVREYTFSPFLKLVVSLLIIGRRLEDHSETLGTYTGQARLWAIERFAKDDLPHNIEKKEWVLPNDINRLATSLEKAENELVNTSDNDRLLLSHRTFRKATCKVFSSLVRPLKNLLQNPGVHEPITAMMVIISLKRYAWRTFCEFILRKLLFKLWLSHRLQVDVRPWGLGDERYFSWSNTNNWTIFWVEVMDSSVQAPDCEVVEEGESGYGPEP